MYERERDDVLQLLGVGVSVLRILIARASLWSIPSYLEEQTPRHVQNIQYPPSFQLVHSSEIQSHPGTAGEMYTGHTQKPSRDAQEALLHPSKGQEWGRGSEGNNLPPTLSHGNKLKKRKKKLQHNTWDKSDNSSTNRTLT